MTGCRQSVAILGLLALADELSEVRELSPYLRDPCPEVRVAALDVLTEVLPSQAGVPLAHALGDSDAGVRRAAIAGLEETRQWFEQDSAVLDTLEGPARSPDPAVKAAVVRLCRLQGWKDRDWFAERMSEVDVAVRKEAVRGLVALNAVSSLHAVLSDPSPEVRRLAAESISRVRSAGASALALAFVRDPEHLVRAKALESLGSLGCPPEAVDIVLALAGEESWQVRRGVAVALGASAEPVGLMGLCALSTDCNLDVRKAAVRSLARWASEPPAIAAAVAALDDVDADVRAYARMALGEAG